jgi:two-component system, OmpR family, sensor kinase
MFTQSIRWRLQLWLAFLLVCVLAGFGVTVYQLQRLHQLNQIDEALGTRVAALGSAFHQPPPPFERGPAGPPFNRGPGDRAPAQGRVLPSRPDGSGFGPPDGRPDMPGRPRELRLSPEALGLFDAASTNDFYVAVWARDGKLLKGSTNAPANVPCPERPAAGTRMHARMRDAFREAYFFTEMGDCLLAGRSLAAFSSAMRRFAGLLLAAGGGVLALGLGGGWWLAGRAIRPIDQISAAASRISAGNLSERIDVAEADSELGRLAGVLNSTFARLEAAFAQQAQFTADASHDLRTPLAVIISEAQTALARERSAADYRETIEGCLGTAQQMRRLTESLLELARFDAGQEAMKREPLDLSRVVRECVELVRPLAEQRKIELDCDLPALQCPGDAERLSQVATNLLTNAIQFNREQGKIRVSVDSTDSSALLQVADTGEGIPTEDLPHIFERFYRADKARSRVEGRNGLGLAICKAIVDAHGGSIEVASRMGVGSTFTVKLPLK